MHDERRFRETCLALIALNWDALERVDQLLRDAGDAWATPASEGRLQWLRLELLLLGTSAARCFSMQQLSGVQHQQLQELVAKLLEWLDFTSATSGPIVRLRLAAAQDWLLEEASWMSDGESGQGLERLRG
jgi:hypothetical protein